jgi:hypothetical protein
MKWMQRSVAFDRARDPLANSPRARVHTDGT